MIKMHSRIAAAFLVMAMLFAMLPANVFAANSPAGQPGETSAQVSNDKLEISGTNSFGNLVASTIEDYNNGEYSDEAATREYSVTDIEMNGTTATVEYGALHDCTLVVAIYDEDGIKMLGSGKADVTADKQLAEVEVSISAMPQYYLVKAFLLNPATNAPLSKVYTCELYTEAIQNIKNATMDDFADREVLNLDNSTETNFAVYGDDVNVIRQSGGKNVYDAAASDPNSGKYVFTNADSEFTSLKVGDVFSHENGTDVTIVKVASVSVEQNADGTYTVTVTEDKDIDMQDVFDYVKIENNGKIDSYTIDDSVADEGITPVDEISTSEAEMGGTYDIIKKELKIEEEYETDPKNESVSAKIKLSATFKINLSVKIKVYLSLSECYMDFSLNFDSSLVGSATGVLQLDSASLFELGISPVPGIYIMVTPKLEFKATASIELNASLKASIGFKCSTNDGLQNTSSKPDYNSSVGVTGTVFFGLNFKPEIKVISENVADASMSGRAGLEIKGTLKKELDQSENIRHECKACMDGDFNFIAEVSAAVELCSKWKFQAKIVPLSSTKIGDWYESIDHNKRGFGTCPYVSYKVTVNVKDSSGNPAGDVPVYNANDTSTELGRTDSSGKLVLYFSDGNYSLTAKLDELSASTTFEVKSEVADVTMSLSEMTDEEKYGSVVKSGSCGTKVTYTLYENGLMIISGSGAMLNYETYSGMPWYSVRSNIKKVQIQGNVSSIGNYAFYDCDSLTDVVFLNSAEYFNCIGDRAFSYCDNLANISTIPVNIEYIGIYAFCSCPNLTSINVDSNNDYYSSIDEVLFNKRATKLICCPAGRTGAYSIPNSVTSITASAFSGCSSLTSVTIPDSVTSIGNSAFSGCSSLTSVTIPDSVTSMGDWAFSSCSSLASVTIPDSVTSIESYAFCKCSSLMKVTIPDSVAYIGESAFSSCSSLMKVTIPDSVTSIGEYAFSSCSSLTNVTIPDSVTSIGARAFDSCSNLRSIKISNSIKVISSEMFSQCSQLSSVTIPDSVTSIVNRAFWSCIKLTSIIIPNSVTSIGSTAFYNCGKLTVYYTGTEEEWNNISIDNSNYANNPLINATIHYNYTGASASSAPAASSGNASGLSAQAIGSIAVRTATFNDLIPGTDYVMVAVKSATAPDLFAADNLLYIDQKTAGDSGTLTFAYELREEYESAVIKIFGTAKTGIADAVVTAGKLPYTGEMQSPIVTVTLNGKKLVKDADYTLSGTTEATEAGTYTFTVIGIGDYKGTVEGEFEITATEIKTNVSEITMLKGTTFATQVWRYPAASTDKITYKSSDESIATVDANGVITAVAKGKATVTATAESGNSAQIKVTALDSLRRPTTSISINKSAYTLTIKRSKLNPTVGLYASIKGDGTGKLWYSDNINVATVNKSGKVTAVGEGTAKIYCRTADGSTSAPCVITVNAFRIDSDNLRDNIIYVNAGDKCKVNLNNTSASGEITWKSSNAKYASIDANGNVTALKKGTVTITATAPDKSKDTCKLIIVTPTDGVKMNKTAASIYTGKSVSLKASLTTRGSNEPVFWTSSNTSVATVSSKGVVKGIKQGKVTITATTFNGKKTTATVTVMTKAAELKFTKITPALYMDGNTGKFTVAITSPATSNDTITWSTSNKSVIAIERISADGKTITIKSGKKGTATITARAGSGKRITYKVTSV
ncbi:MAG: leucine-rich repeat protein, partial [Acutalibacteraceae bacterium]